MTSSPQESPPELVIPSHIRALQPYQPGKPIEDLERELGITGAIKVASNENPLGPSPLGLAAAREAAAQMHRYPDGGQVRLREAIAVHDGVSASCVVQGAGSNELIELLVQGFCEPGRHEVLSHRAAFVMYKLAAKALGVHFVEAASHPDLSVDLDALADAIGPATRLIFLPNPNNPTGHVIPRVEFERFLARVPARVILVVDEAYFEYAADLDPEHPVAERYRGPEHPWIVTLRTFSKIYGLAGLRVGYAVCDPQIAEVLHRIRMPFNVGSVAAAAALAALGDTEHVERSLRDNAQGLAHLRAGFDGLGLAVTPSAGNFLLVDLAQSAAPVYQALLRHGVITRPLLPYALPNHLRISVGTRVENARTLSALAECLGPAPRR